MQVVVSFTTSASRMNTRTQKLKCLLHMPVELKGEHEKKKKDGERQRARLGKSNKGEEKQRRKRKGKEKKSSQRLVDYTLDTVLSLATTDDMQGYRKHTTKTGNGRKEGKKKKGST
jgi:hypothetical protein